MCVAAPGRFLLNDSSVAALYERRIYSTPPRMLSGLLQPNPVFHLCSSVAKLRTS